MTHSRLGAGNWGGSSGALSCGGCLAQLVSYLRSMLLGEISDLSDEKIYGDPESFSPWKY